MGYTKPAEKPAKIPFPSNVILSDFQGRIKDSWLGDNENKIIQAVAGSGKSFTLSLLAHHDTDRSAILFTSFMVAIVEAMEPKMPDHVICKGAHSLGRAAIVSAYKPKGVKVDKWKIKNLVQTYDYMMDREDPSSEERVDQGVDLVSKMKLTMTDPENTERILKLCDIYDIEIDCLDRFMRDLPALFKKNDDLAKQGIFDFDDMIYMVVKYDLKVYQYKRVMVDECQDFSPLMQKFIAKFIAPNGKICVVGDKNQSIMGFAGADTNSMSVMKNMFNAVELPLSVCYRCPSLVVELAQAIVPQILPHEKAKPGIVRQYQTSSDRFEWSNVHDESMILCRRNAPLMGPAFKLLKEGKKVTVKGRNIAEGLIKLINKLMPDGGKTTDLIDKVTEWCDQKVVEIMNRKVVNVALVDLHEDKRDIIIAFCEEHKEVIDVCFKLKSIFDDKTTTGIIMSTAHRSKGLEHSNVYIIDYANFEMSKDNMSEDAKQQERNLRYVGLTRPMEFLGLLP